MVETKTLAEAFAEVAGQAKGTGQVKLYSINHHLALKAMSDAIDSLSPSVVHALQDFINSKEPSLVDKTDKNMQGMFRVPIKPETKIFRIFLKIIHHIQNTNGLPKSNDLFLLSKDVWKSNYTGNICYIHRKIIDLIRIRLQQYGIAGDEIANRRAGSTFQKNRIDQKDKTTTATADIKIINTDDEKDKNNLITTFGKLKTIHKRKIAEFLEEQESEAGFSLEKNIINNGLAHWAPVKKNSLVFWAFHALGKEIIRTTTITKHETRRNWHKAIFRETSENVSYVDRKLVLFLRDLINRDNIKSSSKTGNLASQLEKIATKTPEEIQANNIGRMANILSDLILKTAKSKETSQEQGATSNKGHQSLSSTAIQSESPDRTFNNGVTSTKSTSTDPQENTFEQGLENQNNASPDLEKEPSSISKYMSERSAQTDVITTTPNQSQQPVPPLKTEALPRPGLRARTESEAKQSGTPSKSAEKNKKPLVDASAKSYLPTRIGQGSYRRRIVQIWGGCCAVTGNPYTDLLIASHCKPWNISNDSERLDGNNGLLLTPGIDKLFDRGVISFDDEGRLLVRNDFKLEWLSSMGLSEKSRLARINNSYKL